MATHQNREMCRWKKGGRTSGRETGEVRVRTQGSSAPEDCGKGREPMEEEEATHGGRNQRSSTKYLKSGGASETRRNEGGDDECGVR